MEQKKIYCIGNAHIDPVWLWRWQEGFAEVKATFRSALDRMNEYPDFVFTASSSIFYEWVEKNNPEMFEEIKARVKEGRWELAGGWLIEPDCNIPCGEAFARHGLYGQRYFMRTFGKTAKTAFNVDSFGHAGTLPQILAKSGIDNYVFLRPMPNEKGFPGRIFWWCSQDGSKVLAYRIPYEYATRGAAIEPFLERLKGEFLDDIHDLALFYGVGNHGGGPTKANIESIMEIDSRESDFSLSMSAVNDFFEAVRDGSKDYPIVRDELQHHASGCYSVNSQIKKYNKLSENALLASERFCAIANVLKKQPYPSNFERAWKNVLFNQFHDILAGCSLVSAYEDARNAYGEAINIAETNLNYALQAISWDIDISQEENMTPLVVFNPHSWGGKMVCETEVRFADEGEIKLLDDTGKPVRVQMIQSESVTPQRRILFIADLPSMGYRTYRLYTKQETALEHSHVSATEAALESSRIRLEINPNTGNVISLYDKVHGVELLSGEGARLVVIEDKSDTWGHNVFKFDKEIATMKPTYIRLLEDGPVRSVIRVKYRYKDSYVCQDFRVYNDLEYVEVKVSVDWREPLVMLKIEYPVNLHFRKPTYEIPFGYIERDTCGLEEPGQSWFDFSGEAFDAPVLAGLSIANTAKYSYSTDVDKMAITVLKNSPYAHHDPAELDSNMEYTYVDNGPDEFIYCLHPHKGTWKQGNIARIARELNTRPVIIPEAYHSGSMPQSQTFLSVDKPQVMVSAVKESEDKDGIIVRAYELHNQHVDAIIDVAFMGREITAHFAPCEIKTFKIPYADGEVVETNLLEW